MRNIWRAFHQKRESDKARDLAFAVQSTASVTDDEVSDIDINVILLPITISLLCLSECQKHGFNALLSNTNLFQLARESRIEQFVQLEILNTQIRLILHIEYFSTNTIILKPANHDPPSFSWDSL